MNPIASLDNLPDNDTQSISVGERSLLLVRAAGRLFIYENRCPHMRKTLDPDGGSLASGGGLLIQCQRHAAEFIANTGECVAGPCLGEALTTVPFTLTGNDVFLRE